METPILIWPALFTITDSMCLKTFDMPADVLRLLGDGLKLVPQLINSIYETGEWLRDFI
jgi:hypothetical protein